MSLEKKNYFLKNELKIRIKIKYKSISIISQI